VRNAAFSGIGRLIFAALLGAELWPAATMLAIRDAPPPF
jgi:hypothetical protein